MRVEGIVNRISNMFPDISRDVIEEVFRSEWKFLLEHFKERNNKAINIIHLGKFLKNSNYDEFGRSRKNLARLEKYDLHNTGDRKDSSA